MWKVLSPSICRDSARRLQEELNEDYPITAEKLINWGNSGFRVNNPVNVFGNKCEAVARSANKKTMFKLLESLGTVPVVEHYSGPCFQHHDVAGHNGSGVTYCNNRDSFVPGLLTTKEIKGIEWRVYFAYGTVLGIYKKVRVEALGSESSPIRTSHNGWGYQENADELHNVVNLKQTLTELAVDASDRLELSYGAVDIMTDHDWSCYILETNSAPTLITNSVTSKLAKIINQKFGE